MNNLKEKANKYSDEKVVDILKETFAKVYSDGYKEGYTDCEGKTVFIDLGLPSGTLWATDYERKYGEIVYLPYTKAFLSDIPTVEQWRELTTKCHWEFKGDREECKRHLVCTGPNGNSILFFQTDFPTDKDNTDSFAPIHFWINEASLESSRNAAFMDCKYEYDKSKWKFIFIQKESNMEDKFTLRLVRNK